MPCLSSSLSPSHVEDGAYQYKFSKMHGLGNDFIVIPLPPIALEELVVSSHPPSSSSSSSSLSAALSTHGHHPLLLPLMANNGERIRAMASRKRGIGCDQFIVYAPQQQQEQRRGAGEKEELEETEAVAAVAVTSAVSSSPSPLLPPSSSPLPIETLFMWIFNGASGEEVGMCGNAVRCVARHRRWARHAAMGRGTQATASTTKEGGNGDGYSVMINVLKAKRILRCSIAAHHPSESNSLSSFSSSLIPPPPVSVHMGPIREGMLQVMARGEGVRKKEEESAREQTSAAAAPQPLFLSSLLLSSSAHHYDDDGNTAFSPTLAEAFGHDANSFARFVLNRIAHIQGQIISAEKDAEAGGGAGVSSSVEAVRLLFASRLGSHHISSSDYVALASLLETVRSKLVDLIESDAIALVSVCDVGNPHCVFVIDKYEGKGDGCCGDDGSPLPPRPLLISAEKDTLFFAVVGLVVECCLQFDEHSSKDSSCAPPSSSIFPQGTNVEFAFVQKRGGESDHRRDSNTATRDALRSVRMRVWERGEGITEACGSGACAVGVAAHVYFHHHLRFSDVDDDHVQASTTVGERENAVGFEGLYHVQLDGGTLTIGVDSATNTILSPPTSLPQSDHNAITIRDITMAGDATLVASGELFM